MVLNLRVKRDDGISQPGKESCPHKGVVEVLGRYGVELGGFLLLAFTSKHH